MRSPKFPVVPTLLIAALVAAAVVDCGGDDTTGEGPGGSAGASGKGGGGNAGTVNNGGSVSNGGNAGTVSNGGNAGTVSNGGAGMGGSAAGMAGNAGAGGTADSGTDAKVEGGSDAKVDVACTTSVIHTAPSGLPSQVALQVTGAVLIGGYHAAGDQIYTCNPIADAGPDATDDAGRVLVGTWTNTAEAVLTGDACAKAADHFFPGPTWKAVDGSSVTASRDDATDPPGDGGAVTAIKWLRLKATGNGGEGIFSNATWVQRINTTGGLQPSANCDATKAADAGGVVRVPYTADYFFYSGGTSSEAGSDATSDASDDGSADSGG